MGLFIDIMRVINIIGGAKIIYCGWNYHTTGLINIHILCYIAPLSVRIRPKFNVQYSHHTNRAGHRHGVGYRLSTGWRGWWYSWTIRLII